MKKSLFLFFVLCTCSLFAQTYSPDFLDGRIMFRLRGDVSVFYPAQKDPNHYALPLAPANYPQLQQAFSGFTITGLEKPSFYTGKKELQDIFRVYFSDFSRIDELMERLRQIPGVEFAEKEPIYRTDFVPNDTYHSGNNKWYHNVVGSEAAWDFTQGSNNIKIAIVDNAVFSNHADLTTYLQRDVADNDNDATPPLTASQDMAWSHGTHCAGLATADINNNTGIASLGANVELIGVKATPNSASSSNTVWYSYEGVQWACANGAQIVSMSFGGTTSSSAFQALINAYPNVVFFAAAGNSASTTLNYPGAYNNVICVGSIDNNSTRSSFSNYNGATPYVDIAAPGGYSFGGLFSTVYTSGGNGYDQMGGTSMATPFAAGLAGLILSINPTLTPAQVENCIESTGANINQAIGPRINAPAAVQCALATLNGNPIPYFSGNPLSIIEGGFVSFNNLSVDGGNPISSYSWSFPGGTPSTFSGQTPPQIQYNAAGTYSVSLSVTNSQSTQTYTANNYVNVSILPYGEWIVQNSGFTTASRGINHISIVDQNTVWATAYDGTAAAANVQQFTKTTNGGTTWTPGNINIGNANLGISMIHAFSANRAWLAAYPSAAGQTGGIWITNNGGNTWTRQNTATFNNAASFTNTVHFWGQDTGLCMGDPINGEFEIYTTVNGGSNWTIVPGANIPNPQTNEFGYVRQMEVVGTHVWFGTSTGRIYYSANRGLNWSVYTSPVADFGGAVTTGVSANLSFSSPVNGMIVNQAGSVWVTNNGGSTWTPVTTTGSVFTSGLCLIEGTNIAFTTGAATGAAGSSYSTNGGQTWNLIDTQQHLYVDFINPSVGWSGWFNTSATQNGMWKWNNLSAFSPDFNVSSPIVCTNQQVNFTDQTTGNTPSSWQWQFPGGNPATSTLQNPTVSYAAPGVYDVTLTVSNGSASNSITQTAVVTVVAPATTPSAISGPLTVCENSQQTYSVLNANGVFYNWFLPSGWSGFTNSNSITVLTGSAGGSVSVNAENVCGASAPSSITVNVDPLAVAGFNFSPLANTVTFTSTSTNATSWFWDFGDGIYSSLENPVHLYANIGSYNVLLVVSNACGVDSLFQNVNITLVGSVEQALPEIRIFPTPAQEQLQIEVPSEFYGSSYSITDASGRLVGAGNLRERLHIINLTDFAKGLYFLRVGNKAPLRFVKE
jgi:PKD repeat protein